MRKQYFLISFLLLSLGTHAQEARDTIKILWIGSSSTYCHDLPRQTAQWLEEYHFKQPVESFLVGKSGTGFHEYLDPGFEAQYGLENGQSLLDKIRDESYDYVVLQMITYFIGAELKEEIEKRTDILCAAIRQSGAVPVFYEMGWRTGPENEIGRQRIQQSARKHKIDIYAACPSAWKEVRSDKPDI
jgi:hypothetical protein